MQRDHFSRGMLKMALLCSACLVLLALCLNSAHAQDVNVAGFSEATRLVNEEYIPGAARALGRRGHADLALLWERATAGEPLLQYQLAGSEAEGFEIHPRYILVPVERDGELVGLFGLDPHTGELGWRLDHVSPAAALQEPPDKVHLSQAIARAGEAVPAFLLKESKLVYAGGSNYWYIPASNASIAEGLFIPVGQERPLTLGDLGLRAGLDGFVVETEPLPASPVEALESPPTTSGGAAPEETATTASAFTSLVDYVPYYIQDCDLWCWAASLSMLHQWWSPVRLGNSYSQQSEIVRYAKGSVTCAGGSADEILRVIRNWHSIDSDYESFATTYKGEGEAFAVGAPTGYNNDPKTWLANLQAPVIAFVDTSGNGKANHAILVIGYDDADSGGVVYIHDPWYSNWWPGHGGERMYELALSYATFDRKWNVTWEGQFFDGTQALAVDRRRGMVAGIPGDNQFAQIGDTSIQLSGPINDGQMERVFDLGLGVLQDDSSAQSDSFGQAYQSGVSVALADPAQGAISEPVELGDLAGYSPVLPASSISFAAGSIPENGQRGGASFHVDPKVLGEIRLQTTWFVYDQDDRWHDQNTVSVLDDRGGSNTAFAMPKPVLARDSRGPSTASFQVEDDDTSGPSVTDYADSGDVAPGTYAFKIRLSDPSGVLDDAEYPRIYLRWDSDEIDGTQHDGYVDTGWDGLWYVGTIEVGPDRLGYTLYWRAQAYDADDDRPGDGTASWSPVYKGGTITDDAPPACPGNIRASDGTYTDKVRVTWDGSTHVESYKVYRSSTPDGPREEVSHLSGASYDDVSVPAGVPHTYWVVACSASQCSAFDGHDLGYRAAGPLKVIGTRPAGNGLEVDPSEAVSVTFSRTVDPGTVNTDSFAVRGQQSGSYQGAYSLDEDSVQFRASGDFRPGEAIVVNLGPGIQAPDGTPLIPYTWQFRSAVSGGSGTFVDSGQNLGSYNSFAVALGDLDSDGDLDAFVGNHSQGNRVWLNDGGQFKDSGQTLGSANSFAVTLGDLDADGDLDAFVANFDYQPDKVWLNDGSGAFSDGGQSLGSIKSTSVALGDLDGDGDLDAFVGNGSGTNRIWLNDGGKFTDSGQSLGSSYSYGLALGDLDGDGDLDAFVANTGAQPDIVWLNQGGVQGGTRGIFSDSGQRLGGAHGVAVALGDLDGDGDLDALVANREGDEANKLWLNDGGRFSDSGQNLGWYWTWAVALGDVDGDGDLDAFLGNLYGQPDRVWLNDGGTFSDSDQSLGAMASAAAATDEEIHEILANLSSRAVALGDLEVYQALATPSSRAVALGDLDDDGDLDAFVGMSPTANKVWLNKDGGKPCYRLTLNHTGLGDDPTANPPNSAGCTSGQYLAGEEITLTPYPGFGQCLDEWTGTDAPNSSHLVMPASAHTATVHYRPCTGSRVRVGSGQVDPGGSITIPVEALEMPGAGLGAFTIEVHYDPAVVRVENCKHDPGGLYSGLCHDDGQRIRLTGVSTVGVPGDSLLAEVILHAVGSDGDSTFLDVELLTIADPDGEPIDAGDEDGVITIGVPDGDVTCDNTTNASDAMFILQREVGLRPNDSNNCPLPGDALYRPGCDVSRDGLCNVIDALFILQCEIGIPNSFCPSANAVMPPVQEASAASDITLTIGSGTLAPGGSITVPLTASLGQAKLAAATVTIQYDPAVLKATACAGDPGDAFDLAVCNAGKAVGEVGFTAISTVGASDDVTLARVTFEARGAGGNSSPLALAADPFAGPGGQALEVTIQNGQIEVWESGDHKIYLPLVRRE
jgi:hypothetical protein